MKMFLVLYQPSFSLSLARLYCDIFDWVHLFDFNTFSRLYTTLITTPSDPFTAHARMMAKNISFASVEKELVTLVVGLARDESAASVRIVCFYVRAAPGVMFRSGLVALFYKHPTRLVEYMGLGIGKVAYACTDRTCPTFQLQTYHLNPRSRRLKA